jgi:hypothetical protein
MGGYDEVERTFQMTMKRARLINPRRRDPTSMFFIEMVLAKQPWSDDLDLLFNRRGDNAEITATLNDKSLVIGLAIPSENDWDELIDKVTAEVIAALAPDASHGVEGSQSQRQGVNDNDSQDSPRRPA